MAAFFKRISTLIRGGSERSGGGKNRAPQRTRAIALVAFVLTVLAFQFFAFVYRAGERILLAHRDAPDTIFVIDSALAAKVLEGERKQNGVAKMEAKEGSGKGSARAADGESFQASGTGRGGAVFVRKNAAHPAPTVGSEKGAFGAARRAPEAFRFDPNTASVEDLCRLGFSERQAESIDNYRKKGGRFRRKSDFAKSYVVSEEAFRRLEPFIDIPLLDLNRADSAAFDALPGIGGYFARQMVLHRSRLGGYSDPRQLLEIYHFTQEKLDAIADLITLDTAAVRPYSLWTLPADSLRLHPAIRTYATALSIVFFREHNPRSEWTVPALQQAGILTPDQARSLSLCKIQRP